MSKSVFCTLDSIRKRVTHPIYSVFYALSVLFEVATGTIGSTCTATNRGYEGLLVKVTESARACSSILSKQIQKICHFWLLTLCLLKFWLFTFPSASI